MKRSFNCSIVLLLRRVPIPDWHVVHIFESRNDDYLRRINPDIERCMFLSEAIQNYLNIPYPLNGTKDEKMTWINAFEIEYNALHGGIVGLHMVMKLLLPDLKDDQLYWQDYGFSGRPIEEEEIIDHYRFITMDVVISIVGYNPPFNNSSEMKEWRKIFVQRFNQQSS